MTSPEFLPDCEVCAAETATLIAKGCMDKEPVHMCKGCYDRGVEIIKTYIHLWMRLNKRIVICGDCHRPIIELETHLSSKELTT